MKKLIITLSIYVFAIVSLFAQAPEKMNYQGVARDGSGNILISAPLALRITIRSGSPLGTPVFSETHSTTTNEFGLFNIEIGSSGTIGFDLIDWGSNVFYMQVEVDPSGGSSYVDVGTSQLLSVPYALYAKTAGNPGPTGPTGLTGATGPTGLTGATGPGGAGGTLDQAYDFGGSGAGRVITADNGAVRINGDDGLLVTGTHGTGDVVEVTGAGTRMFFNPRKSAFRAGYLTGVTGSLYWDDANIGNYSTALGYNTKASGNISVSIGGGTISTGQNSVSIGNSTQATGDYSTALGLSSIASGKSSTAIGFLATASGDTSVAIGSYTSTNGKAGSFVIGDVSTITVASSSTTNQFTSRFAGGYRFFSDATYSIPNTMVYNSGNLGIGTTSPSAKIEVAGQVKITGGSPGAGKVLTSDANGLATWQTVSSGTTGWALTGNSISSSDFLGTTNNVPLVFKVNNQRSGYLNSTGTTTSFGFSALPNSTGNQNSAFGFLALNGNTSGNANTAMGYNTLKTNGTGGNNVAVGYAALANNTDGGYNVAVGSTALSFNTIGEINTAIGYNTLYNNTSGNYNVAIGNGALKANTVGNDNVAIGSGAMINNKKGNQNAAYGNDALFSLDSGFSNVAIGVKALYRSVGGYNNVAVGDSSLFSSRTTISGEFTTVGNRNTAVGSKALCLNVDGEKNVAIGVGTGYKSLGTNCTFLGVDADVNVFNAAYQNSTALGYATSVTTSNQVRIGNGVTSIGGPQNWTNTSDGRFKINVVENVPGIEFIKKLRPVTYNMDWKAHDKYIRGENLHSDKHYSEIGSMVHSGFIAQEVETAAKEMNYNFSGVDAPKNDKDVYGLRYSDFVVPMIKAMQEQQLLIEKLQAEVEQLKNK